MVPTQLNAVGVMVIVAVSGVVPALVAVNDGMIPGMVPVPPDPRPMEVLLLLQVKVVTDTGPVTAVEGATTPVQ